MASATKPNSGQVPVTTAEEVRHFTGPISDHTVVEILGTHPTIEQLEIAALHARGQSGRPNEEVEELSGSVAVLYDLLMQDELYLPEER